MTLSPSLLSRYRWIKFGSEKSSTSGNSNMRMTKSKFNCKTPFKQDLYDSSLWSSCKFETGTLNRKQILGEQKMEIDGDCSKGNNTEEPCGKTSKTQQSQQPQPHKKQVRRRLHTSRPYQERLLNMAEARREIVTALKQHRAAMKQASEQQHHHQETQPDPLQVPPQIYLEQEARTNSRKNHPKIYPLTDSPNCLDGLPSSFPRNHPPHPPHPDPFPFSCPVSQIPNLFSSNPLDFDLPNQPLGLNLNFNDFNNIETSLYSSPSSSSSPCMSFASEEIPLTVTSHEVGAESGGGGALHQVLDEKEMVQIQSVGEQHQMEWNDSMNLVTSAWWFKFLKTIDLETQDKAEDNCYHPFDEVMEFPSWLNTNEPYFSDYSSDDHRQDPALPCMEIGEIEGIDGEWLA